VIAAQHGNDGGVPCHPRQHRRYQGSGTLEPERIARAPHHEWRMAGVDIPQLTLLRRHESGDQGDESIGAERGETCGHTLHDGMRIERIDVRRVKRALDHTGEHRR